MIPNFNRRSSALILPPLFLKENKADMRQFDTLNEVFGLLEESRTVVHVDELWIESVENLCRRVVGIRRGTVISTIAG